jgi:hypothetical protein
MVLLEPHRECGLGSSAVAVPAYLAHIPQDAMVSLSDSTTTTTSSTTAAGYLAVLLLGDFVRQRPFVYDGAADAYSCAPSGAGDSGSGSGSSGSGSGSRSCGDGCVSLDLLAGQPPLRDVEPPLSEETMLRRRGLVRSLVEEANGDVRQGEDLFMARGGGRGHGQMG